MTGVFPGAAAEVAEVTGKGRTSGGCEHESIP